MLITFGIYCSDELDCPFSILYSLQYTYKYNQVQYVASSTYVNFLLTMADTIRQLFVVVTVDKTPSEDVSFGHSTRAAEPGEEANEAGGEAREEAERTGKLTTTAQGRSPSPGQNRLDDDDDEAFGRPRLPPPDPPSERYELRMRNAQDTAGAIKGALMVDMQLLLDQDAGKDTAGTKAAPLQSYNQGLVLLRRYPDVIATKVLSYLGDILEDGDTLDSFGARPNAYGYVELHLRLVTARNENPSDIDRQMAKEKGEVIAPSQGSAADNGDIDVKKIPLLRDGGGWAPLPREARSWLAVPGQPHPKTYVLHAMRTGGACAILRVMERYPKHARNQEECLFALVMLASVSGNGKQFRDRLVLRTRALSLATMAARSFAHHIGVQKQALAFACYCCSGVGTSAVAHPRTGKKCVVSAPPQLTAAILSTSFARYGGGGPLVLKALAWATDELEGMTPSERLGVRGSSLGDVLEYGFSLLSTLLQFVKSADGGAEEWEDFDGDKDTAARATCRDAVMKLVAEGPGIGGLRASVARGVEAVVGCSFEESAKKAGAEVVRNLDEAVVAGVLAVKKKGKKSKK